MRAICDSRWLNWVWYAIADRSSGTPRALLWILTWFVSRRGTKSDAAKRKVFIWRQLYSSDSICIEVISVAKDGVISKHTIGFRAFSSEGVAAAWFCNCSRKFWISVALPCSLSVSWASIKAVFSVSLLSLRRTAPLELMLALTKLCAKDWITATLTVRIVASKAASRVSSLIMSGDMFFWYVCAIWLRNICSDCCKGKVWVLLFLNKSKIMSAIAAEVCFWSAVDSNLSNCMSKPGWCVATSRLHMVGWLFWVESKVETRIRPCVSKR